MWQAGSRTAIAVSLALPALAQAQSAAPAQRESQPPRTPAASARQLRLSDWLLQQKPGPDAYPLGLSWRVPDEVPPQMALKLELVALLAGEDRVVRADATAMQRMRHWIAGLPATGRVPVALAEGRWLQMNPAHDPVLVPGYSVVMPQRPRTVTVISGDGTRCAVVHQAGREAKAYIDACRSAGGARSDWAWIAQPDGRVQRFGVAAWNEEKQDEPAAGAWIWAPGRARGWPDAFSEKASGHPRARPGAQIHAPAAGSSCFSSFQAATPKRCTRPSG